MKLRELSCSGHIRTYSNSVRRESVKSLACLPPVLEEATQGPLLLTGFGSSEVDLKSKHLFKRMHRECKITPAHGRFRIAVSRRIVTRLNHGVFPEIQSSLVHLDMQARNLRNIEELDAHLPVHRVMENDLVRGSFLRRQKIGRAH